MDVGKVYDWVERNRAACIEDLRRLLRQPSISAQGAGVRECADLLVQMLTELGMSARTIDAGGNPFVFGELRSKSSGKTLLVCNHYDVSPPEPVEAWRHDPFAAVIENDRIIARGATDAKGNLMAHLMAVKAYLELYNDVPVNLKYVFDGEEEIGSPTIERFVAENKDLLSADAVVSLDGGFDPSNRPRIRFGSSGLLYVEIHAQGAAKDLHSARARLVENPAWKLVWILASMKDRDENILIEGFYDDMRPPTPQERALLEQYDWDDELQRQALGVRKFLCGVEGVDALERLLFRPTANIAGIVSGYTEEGSKNVLPSKAVLKMDFRLVPDQDPDDIFRKIKDHVERQGFEGVEVLQKGPRVPPSSSPVDSAIARAVIDAGLGPFTPKAR